jgi:thiamine biosynthesis lipoprotein ApbE
VTAAPAAATFRALGTNVTVLVTNRAELTMAATIVSRHVAAVDAAASRFRPDSQLTWVNQHAGVRVPVSPLLVEAVADALHAARETDGLVTPTVGEALILVGYDRDFAAVPADGPPAPYHLRRVPGWQGVQVDRGSSTVAVPQGVTLDLGATAKAACADRAVAEVASTIDGGVLVNLGGDIAVAGPAPSGGWSIRIADRHDAPADAPSVGVAITTGGLATSGTAARRWSRGGQDFHHVIDPSTGTPAAPCWRTVTVAAATCLAANTASTASIILGPDAPAWLESRRLPARLVADDGGVTTVGEWPLDTMTLAS